MYLVWSGRREAIRVKKVSSAHYSFAASLATAWVARLVNFINYSALDVLAGEFILLWTDPSLGSIPLIEIKMSLHWYN